MKKMIIAVALIAILGLVVCAEASSVEQGAYTCKVQMVGPFFDRIAAYVTNPAFPDGIWVALRKESEKELLATILTARSLGADVWMFIVGDSVNVAGTPMQTVGAVCIIAD